jgi:hypothetical protein
VSTEELVESFGSFLYRAVPLRMIGEYAKCLSQELDIDVDDVEKAVREVNAELTAQHRRRMSGRGSLTSAEALKKIGAVLREAGVSL